MSLRSILLRRIQSDVTELNWHGFVFGELTNGQAVIRQKLNRVSSVQFIYVALNSPLYKDAVYSRVDKNHDFLIKIESIDFLKLKFILFYFNLFFI